MICRSPFGFATRLGSECLAMAVLGRVPQPTDPSEVDAAIEIQLG
jgi:hypothetical protein